MIPYEQLAEMEKRRKTASDQFTTRVYNAANRGISGKRMTLPKGEDNGSEKSGVDIPLCAAK